MSSLRSEAYSFPLTLPETEEETSGSEYLVDYQRNPRAHQSQFDDRYKYMAHKRTQECGGNKYYHCGNFGIARTAQNTADHEL